MRPEATGLREEILERSSYELVHEIQVLRTRDHDFPEHTSHLSSRARAIRLLLYPRNGGEMRFLFLIHGDSDGEAALSADERRAIVEQHMAYSEMLSERGSNIASEALEGPQNAAVVRPGPKPIVTDGPFAATKEAIGGFYVVECSSREEAIKLAGRVPLSPGVAVEVLPCVDV